MFLQSTDQLADGVEVRDRGDGDFSLSYVTFPDFRRTGVATRAARLAHGYAAAHLGARIAVIKILEGNLASIGVADRLWAELTGTAASEAGGTLLVYRLDLVQR